MLAPATLAALPSTRAIETRSLPTSLAATHRGFAFYVASPKSSIPSIATCSMLLVPSAPFGSDAPKSFAFALSASQLFSQRLNSSTPQRLNILCQLVSVSHFQKCRDLSLPLFLLLLRLARNRRVLKISRDTECGYRYISLLGQSLRLVSYAVRTLPRLRLRAFRPRSSLPSLSCPI